MHNFLIQKLHDHGLSLKFFLDLTFHNSSSFDMQ